MSFLSRLALLPLLTLACGSTVPERHPPGPESAPVSGFGGSGQDSSPARPTQHRVVPWQLEAEGMPPILLGSYDTEQQVPCEFMADELGELRCLPLVPVNLFDHEEFSDAACQDRIYSGPAVLSIGAGEPISIQLTGASDACAPTRHRVVTLAAPAAGIIRYRLDSTGACSVSDFNPAPEPERVIAERVEPSVWQSAVETAGPRLGELVRLAQYQTSDGANFPRYFEDIALQTRGVVLPRKCHLRGDECWPGAEASEQGHFSDAQCSAKLWRADRCEPSLFLRADEQRFAPEPFLGEVFSFSSKGGCTADPQPASPENRATYFTRGAELPLLRHGSLRLETVGTGRLRHRAVLDIDGAPVLTNDALLSVSDAIYDQLTGASCTPIWTPSAGVRCVDAQSLGSYWDGSYADAACREPAFVCVTGDCEERAFASDTTVWRVRVRASSLFRAVTSSTPVFRNVDGDCRPDTRELSFYTRGPEVPWEQYPELIERNRPARLWWPAQP